MAVNVDYAPAELQLLVSMIRLVVNILVYRGK